MSNEQIGIIAVAALVVAVAIGLTLVIRADNRRIANNKRCASNLNMQRGRHVKPSAAVPSSTDRRPSAHVVSNLTTGVLGASANTSSDS